MEMRRPFSILAITILILVSIGSITHQPAAATSAGALTLEGFDDGRGITAYLYNSGDINLTNIAWTMSLDGPLAIMKKASGTIPFLGIRNHTKIELRHPFGLGRFAFTLAANATEGASVSVVRNMRLRGFVTHILLGEPLASRIKLQRIASGLHAPTVLTSANDGTGRLFVCEQRGVIRIISGSTLFPHAFLDLRKSVVRLRHVFDERGLLGLAFHPDFKHNGKFYVYYSAPSTIKTMDHDNIISEFTVTGNPNVADPATERILLRVPWPQFNHNAGKLAFGPDGYLYIGMGDGGGEGDPHGIIGNAQNLSNLYGKILRIDVNNQSGYKVPADNPFVGTTHAQEIYAYGFRNPFRFSFDNLTGRLYCADVGELLWEEIDLVTKGGNYGWKIYEGFHPYDLQVLAATGLNVSDLTFPVFEYSHLVGLAIIGGFVYHGHALPALDGNYVFADWSKGFLRPSGALYYMNETSPGIFTRYEFTIAGKPLLDRFVLSFGEDEANELYLLTSKYPGPHNNGGQVYKIIAG
jgi:glucose/arabinose dehydrogenase